MRRLIRLILLLACLGLGGERARGHFNMLFPERASVRKGEAVSFLYQWGHPFEHELFEAPAPQSLTALPPGGKPLELRNLVEQVSVPAAEGKQVRAYRFRFIPQGRGDTVFLLRTPPIWMEEDQEFLQDSVKVVLHVQAQNGWDQRIGASGEPDLEMVPLTRPYGLQPGMVFQAQALAGGGPRPVPLAGALVEIERYNRVPPRTLPADEFITRTAKTDPNGVVTCTLPEAGWWAITVQQRGAAQAEHDGKRFPVRQRATLWVHVEGSELPAPAR